MTALWVEGPKKTIKVNIGESVFNEAFRKCPVVRGLRAVYIRTSPIPRSFNAYRIFAQTWADQPSNRLNTDFKLYDNISDALADKGRWSYCNYNDQNIGFPRDCGKTSYISGYKLFSLPGSRGFGPMPSNQGIEIYSGDNCPAKDISGNY